jgi:hypothetical protein
LNSPPPPFSSIFSPIPGIVSTDIILPFTYMCAQYLHYIHHPSPFPHLLLPPTSTNTPWKDLFTLLFFNFV